ncbi:MAG: T9SS type A sorting domain-containing protein [candidate division WOR-3 bacterium]|nr:T9SS type A sorting domain-containing protein [candidate division WOR-3 bacterium]
MTLRMTFAIVIGVFIAFICAHAQAPDTLWTKTYGEWNNEEPHGICQTPDSGYIVVGITNSMGAGDWDIYLIKTDPDGDTMWTQTYGGSNPDAAHAMCLAQDGGYIIVGTRDITDWNVLMMKTDSLGSVLWTEEDGGMLRDWLNGVCPNPGGGYVAVGEINVNSWNTSGNLGILAFDDNGNQNWIRSYGGSSYDGGTSIDTTTNGYIIGGFTNSYGAGGSDVWLVRTNASGISQWTQTFGGVENDWASSVASTADGGYIIAGYTASYGAGSWDAYLIKTDSNGDSIWTRTYGGNLYDAALHVFQTDDGGYIITGFTGGIGEWIGGDIWIMKIDENGDELWTSTYGGVYEDWGFITRPTFDGGYIVAAKTRSIGAGETDIYLIKLAPETGIAENEGSVTRDLALGATIVRGPLPLPSNKEFKVFDISGREVTPHNLRPGIYFIEIENDVVQKVIKVR